MKIILLIFIVFIIWFFLRMSLNIQKVTKQKKLQEQDYDPMRSNVCQICGKVLDEETFKQSEIFCSKCRKSNSPEYIESCRTVWKNRQMKWKEKRETSNKEKGHSTWKNIYQSNPEWRKYYEEELKQYKRLSPVAQKIKIEALREYMEENPDDPPYRDLMDAIQRGFTKK